MKKVKNEQIANKLVDAIGLLKALKTRKQEEIIMIDVFMKDVSDMLKDDKKDEKKGQSSVDKSPKVFDMPSIISSIKPIAGKSLNDTMKELMDAMGSAQKKELLEKQAGLDKAIEDYKEREKVKVIKGRGFSPVDPLTSVPHTKSDDKLEFSATPSTGGGSVSVDHLAAKQVWCAVCNEYHTLEEKLAEDNLSF